ncbi:MAG: response regulator [Lachnospiraceae bacterium]|nr:response regulator [Lachnospiraceae bacterium]
MFNKYKNLFKYLIREELEMQHRLMNIILTVGTVALLVCIVFDFVIGTGSRTFWIMLLLIASFIFSLYVANVRNKPNAAGVILGVVASYFLMPVLYFTEGGKESAMPMWLMLSALFIWLIVRGWPCIIIYIGDIVIYSTLLMIEYYHPELVMPMPDKKAEYVDYIFAIASIVLIFGVIYKFQSRIYERKKKELEVKEQELIELNTSLEAANEAKSDFLARMSHEIRTPINAVIGMDEMILRESSERNVLDYATNIENASQTLLSLINDILDFSKIESGLMKIIPEEYEIYTLLDYCYSLLKIRAGDKGLVLNLEYDKNLPSRLMGDELRIRQIITNLLTNAVKYTDTGSITFRVNKRRKGEKLIDLIISVEDTGRGISEEGIGAIFDSFQRADEKKNRNIEGTGLGLAITKQLVDLMGGSIRVHSRLGDGSEFTVTIPQEIVSDEPLGNLDDKLNRKKTSGENYKEAFKAPKARILIVDDVAVNHKVIKLLLKTTEIQVNTANSGPQCLEMYEKEHYDLILLDHMMPEMDGIETLKRMVMTDKYNKERTPVVALTANAIQGAEKEYIDAGFTDYLTKPVQGADLEKMILKYLPPELVEEQ